MIDTVARGDILERRVGAGVVVVAVVVEEDDNDEEGGEKEVEEDDDEEEDPAMENEPDNGRVWIVEDDDDEETTLPCGGRSERAAEPGIGFASASIRGDDNHSAGGALRLSLLLTVPP